MSAGPDDLARGLVESGLLNWAGPGEITLAASAGGEVMIPETAKQCVDAAFSTPRPALDLEIVDEDGAGWKAAWFSIEYARRLAEWRNRGLTLTYRTASAPGSARLERLAAARVAVRANLPVDGPSPAKLPFPAARVLAVVGAKAADPDGWVSLLARERVDGVTWARAEGAAQPAFSRFAARALARIVDGAETSDLRDETVAALMRGRPWESPGVDVLATLAFGPDGRAFSSEEGMRLAAAGDDLFVLGHAATFKFADLPSNPLVPALVSAALPAAQPLCSSCAYRPYCVIPPSRHYRAQGSLAGRLPDSPECASRLSLFGAVFDRISDEKCLKALQKWGVDIARFTC